VLKEDVGHEVPVDDIVLAPARSAEQVAQDFTDLFAGLSGPVPYSCAYCRFPAANAQITSAELAQHLVQV
jgi:hypothetical protein